MESRDGVHVRKGKKALGMGANCGSTRFLMGSDHSEKDRGGVWGVPCSRLLNREARGVVVGTDSGKDEWRRVTQRGGNMD